MFLELDWKLYNVNLFASSHFNQANPWPKTRTSCRVGSAVWAVRSYILLHSYPFTVTCKALQFLSDNENHPLVLNKLT
jgi:hypothetical protein